LPEVHRVAEDDRLRRHEKLLAAAARLAGVACWTYDARTGRVEASEELCRMLGLAREDAPITPEGFLSLVHPDDRARADATIEGAVRDPHQVAMQVRIVRADGAVRDCQLIADLEPGALPSDGRWVGALQDVTDEVDAARARDSGEERLRQVLDEMPFAFAAIDENRVMRVWNQEAERITGYTRGEIVGNPAGLELLYDEQERARIAGIMAVPETVSRDRRFTLVRKDGERRIVSWSSVVAARGLTGLERTVVGIDVTEAEREAHRYRTLARHLPNGAVLLYDHDLRYLLVEGSDLGALGGDSSQMIGRTMFEAAGSELAAELAPSFRAALEGRPTRREISHDGRDYEVTCLPLYDAGGRLEGGMALTQNISARKRAERAVDGERERLARVFDVIPALVVGVDGAGRTTFVNPAAERTTGYGAAELIGQSWWGAVCRGDERRHVEELMQAMGERGCLRNCEMVLATKSGERRTVSWSGERAPLRQQGTETFLYGLDVTERNEMHERLVIAERMASLGTLAAGVAHEINNPLCYVLSNLGLAVEGLEREGGGSGVNSGPTAGMDGPDEFRALLVEAHHGAQRVAKIVADLRMFSRAGEERSELVDVARSLETCLNMAANELRHRAHVVREIRPVPRVWADEARLGQVFLNLIVNAAQSLPEAMLSTNEVRVSTGTEHSGRVVVEVADNGSGMDAPTMRRIFDPFFTTRPLGIGTGLGLAIAHRIVTGFGGEILVDSEPGKGSVFRVLLPAAEPDAEPVSAPVLRRQAPRRARILIIDDETLVGHTMRRALDRAHDVTLVTSAAEGLEAVAGRPFDVIMCDVMLPGTSGLDFHARLAEERPDQARRVVFITGGAFTDRARQFLEETPNPCIHKPFEPAALLSLVNEYLVQWGPLR
jgi:PAS domain S-box-containing protein